METMVWIPEQSTRFLSGAFRWSCAWVRRLSSTEHTFDLQAEPPLRTVSRLVLSRGVRCDIGRQVGAHSKQRPCHCWCCRSSKNDSLTDQRALPEEIRLPVVLFLWH